jgi:NitT/TauT family transport system permease protein
MVTTRAEDGVVHVRGPDSQVPVTQEGSSSATRVWLWRIVSVAGFGLAWAALLESGLLSRHSFAGPIETLEWFWSWHASGDSLTHLASTLTAAAMGYLIGLLLGAAVAALFVFVRGFESVLDPYMAVVNGIPKIIIAPFVVAVFGLGIWSKVTVAALLVFFVSFFNLVNGLKSVNRALINNLRVLGASHWRMATDLYVPAVFSWAMTTLRIGVGFALIGVIVGEFVGSTHGVGHVIKVAGELNEPARLLGALLTLFIFSILIDRLFSNIERRFSRWDIL